MRLQVEIVHAAEEESSFEMKKSQRPKVEINVERIFKCWTKDRPSQGPLRFCYLTDNSTWRKVQWRNLCVSCFLEGGEGRAFLVPSWKSRGCLCGCRLKDPSMLQQYGGTPPGLGIASVVTDVKVTKFTCRETHYRDNWGISFSVPILSPLPSPTVPQSQKDWLSCPENVEPFCIM